MLPAIATIKPAPFDSLTSLTSTLCPSGAPRTVGSALNDIWVFAIHTGKLP